MARPVEHASADATAPRRRRVVTPMRIVLVLALLASGALVGYALLLDKGRTQIPILASGLTVAGVVLLGLALVAAGSAIRTGRDGSGVLAVIGALLGGLFAIAGAGTLGAAVVLLQLWGSTG